MTIRTKYDVGDKVWLRHNGTAIQGKVSGVYFSWKVGEFPKIEYRIGYFGIFSENDIKKTKFELINNKTKNYE